jgi:hypothetical protein
MFASVPAKRNEAQASTTRGNLWELRTMYYILPLCAKNGQIRIGLA